MSNINSFSVFLENKYYHDFIALYNSWKYYEHITPIKVYVVGPLDNEKRIKIESLVEVIDIDQGSLTIQQFKGAYLFKWIGLLNYMSDYEIILDADTIFLSNTDYLFEFIKQGKLVLAREEVDINHKTYVTPEEWPSEYERIKSEIRKYVGEYADNFTYDLITPTYNAGFLGINKKIHKFILEKSIEMLTSNFDAKKNPISHLEQFNFNFLIDLYKIDKHVLPQLEWMNTWWYHKSPKKIIKVEDGKLGLYNENGSKINFYHFTGDIGVVDERDGLIKTCRMHQLYESQIYEPQFTRKEVEKLWLEKHQNPTILLYEFFHNREI